MLTIGLRGLISRHLIRALILQIVNIFNVMQDIDLRPCNLSYKPLASSRFAKNERWIWW